MDNDRQAEARSMRGWQQLALLPLTRAFVALVCLSLVAIDGWLIWKARQVQLRDAEIETYYKAHLADYMNPEQVSVKYIEVNSADLPLDAAPSDDEPTAKQTSVTLISPSRSRAIARSIRRVIR